MVYPPQGSSVPQETKEPATATGSRREEVSVLEARDRLATLLRRAAEGKEIVITSDGQPQAMLVRYRPTVRGRPWRSLQAFRQAQPLQPDSISLIRADRDADH